MDIDSQRSAHSTPHTCHHCGKADHLIRDCPLHFDVRSMMQDEQEVLFEDLTAERNVVTDETDRVVIECKVAPEDFVHHSK